MAIDFPVQRATRRCSTSGRTLAPDEAFVSALIDEEGRVTRRDYAVDQWDTPPEGAFAWWRREPKPATAGETTPQEVLLRLLDEWADRPEEATSRYLLALLLMRRRVLRLRDGGFAAGLTGAADDDSILRLECRERDEPITVRVAPPVGAERERVQQRLNELLGAA